MVGGGCCLRSGQRLVCVVSGFLFPPPSFPLSARGAQEGKKCEGGGREGGWGDRAERRMKKKGEGQEEAKGVGGEKKNVSRKGA